MPENTIAEQEYVKNSGYIIILFFAFKLNFLTFIFLYLFGQGFSVPSLKKMKKFYQVFNGGSTVWNQLSWSHNRLIMNIDDEKRRNFYLEEYVKSNCVQPANFVLIALSTKLVYNMVRKKELFNEKNTLRNNRL